MGTPARSHIPPQSESNSKLKQLAAEIHGILIGSTFWDEFTENRATFSIKAEGNQGNKHSNAANEAMNRISKAVVLYEGNYIDSRKCSSDLHNAIPALLFMVAVHDLDPELLESHRLDGVTIPSALIEARDSFLQVKYDVVEKSTRSNRGELAKKTAILLEKLAEVKASEPAFGGKHVDVLLKAYEFFKEVEKQINTPGDGRPGGAVRA